VSIINELAESFGEVNNVDWKARCTRKTPTITKDLQAFCAKARKLKPFLQLAV
jgi:hypothetical protein